MHVNAALTLFSNTLLESKNKEMGAVAQRAFICQKKPNKKHINTKRYRTRAICLVIINTRTKADLKKTKQKQI